MVILIILFFFSILIFFIIRKQTNKTESISYLTTLIATLIGVLFAVFLSNYKNERKEKSDTIKVIESSIGILDATYTRTKVLSSIVDTMATDSLMSKNSYNGSVELFKKENPLTYPKLLESIILNNLVVKYMSKGVYLNFLNEMMNLKCVANYESTESYKQSLETLSLYLKKEIEFQKGNINEEELELYLSDIELLMDKKYPKAETNSIDLTH